MGEILGVALLFSVLLILAFVVVGRLLSAAREWVVSRTGNWVIFFTFIGVVHHELSHLLLALLTGAKVQSVVLFRLKAKDGNVGEVKFIPRGWNIAQSMQVVLASVAPMLMGLISLLILIFKVNPIVSDGWQVFMWYVEFAIFLNMSLSKQDVRNILTRLGWLLIVLTLMFICLFLLADITTFRELFSVIKKGS